jgi:hypothetical protein
MDRARRSRLGETFGIGIRSGQDGGAGVIGHFPSAPGVSMAFDICCATGVRRRQ